MSLFSVFKRNSKLALRNNWGKAILAMLITMAVTFALSILQQIATTLFVGTSHSFNYELYEMYGEHMEISDVLVQSMLASFNRELWIVLAFSVLSLLLVSPVQLGLVNWYYQLVHGRSNPLTELFQNFESFRLYRRSVWYYVNIGIRTYLWALLVFLVPSAILGGSIGMLTVSGYDRSLQSMATLGLILGLLLLLLCMVLFMAIINRYFLTAYLLCKSPEMSVRQAIKQSVAYTKGYRLNLLGFELSFVGWALLCVFVFPAFYVLPYMNTSFAMYARYLIERNQQQEQNATQEFVVGASHASSGEFQPPASGGSADLVPEGPADLPPEDDADMGLEQGDAPIPAPEPEQDDGFSTGFAEPVENPVDLPDLPDAPQPPPEAQAPVEEFPRNQEYRGE